MSNGVSFELSADDQRQFASLISEMQSFTGRELGKIVRNVGRDFVKKAIKNTPVAPRFVSSSFYRARGGHWYKGKSRRIRIKHRGYAKSAWGKALKGLGLKPTMGMQRWMGSGSIRAGHFVDGLSKPSPFVEIGNKVPYIEALDKGDGKTSPHHIMSKSIIETQLQMRRTLSRLSRRWRERWR